MPEPVIVDAVRTPIGRAFKGSLAQLRPDEMGAFVVDALLERNEQVDPALVEEVYCGVGLPQGLQAFNMGRIVALLSERLPLETNGTTVSRYCASSLESIRQAANAVVAGQGDAYIAAGVAPIWAIKQVLERAGMLIADVDTVELNEAFAAQVIPIMAECDIPLEKLNPHGGAIALGHPFGMTGARIMCTLLNDLETVDGTIGLETMCVGGGQGMAMIVERLN